MTIAFVHGNPETDAIWDELVDELAGKGAADLVLLEPPGFLSLIHISEPTRPY